MNLENNKSSDLEKNLNSKISELDEYFENLIIEINKINEKTNTNKEIDNLIIDIKTKIKLLESATLNEEE
jgi:hypothetical protein|tara:strand:+ start:3507 stop:3716 length:210 start_codon:yes stop_codon:yes gene_type:complete